MEIKEIKEEEDEEDEDESANGNNATPLKGKKWKNFDSAYKEKQAIRNTAYDEVFFRTFDFYIDETIKKMKNQEQ